MSFTAVTLNKAKIHYTSFPVASP